MCKRILGGEKSHGLRKPGSTRCVAKYKKRKQVRRACEHCRRSKTGCSSFRPCKRCVKHNMADQCVDAPRKGACSSPRKLAKPVVKDTPKPETMPKALATCHHNHISSDETASPCLLSMPSPEAESLMDLEEDDLGVEADYIRNEPAPPKELWNYLETIISKENLTEQDHDVMWSTLSDESNDAVVPDVGSNASPPTSSSRLLLFSPSFEEEVLWTTDAFDAGDVCGSLKAACSASPSDVFMDMSEGCFVL